jgi:hypothetical protein
MQCFVRLHAPHIVPVQQPVELLTGECEYHIGTPAWPVKALLLQALVPDDEAVALPHQDLQLVTGSSDIPHTDPSPL